MRTWKAEIAVVAGVLGTVAIASGGGVVELLGATAVTLSFAHAQVADRLAEGESERRKFEPDEIADRHAVDCYRWAGRYLVSKEILWSVYFVAHRSWSALAGVGLFIAYPAWRRWWRARYPIGRTL